MDMKEKILEHMTIVGSNGLAFGEVDRVEGEAIKVTKDDQGKHHWIPLGWVTRVEEEVHLDRSGEQAMREWMAEAPKAA
jgi:hypothetical protein